MDELTIRIAQDVSTHMSIWTQAIAAKCTREKLEEQFASDKIVLDVIRGHVRIENNNATYVDAYVNNNHVTISNFPDCHVDNTENSIVLILESPHKDEYTDDDKFRPIAPAQGKTGGEIKKELERHVLSRLYSC